jgi:kumamolisin
MPGFGNYLRVGQRATTGDGYDPRAVARCYGYPLGLTGRGFTGGLIELGGGYQQQDLAQFFAAEGLPVPDVQAVPVAGGRNTPGGDADAEVLLDIQVAAAVAPGAAYRVYFAPNTDDGFLAAVEQAAAECDVVSISWGAAEPYWTRAALNQFDAAFAAARRAGCVVYAAAGDTGSSDSTSGTATDYPASDPNVIGCGGTELVIGGDGRRVTEVTWDLNDRTSATGGGVSTAFGGTRQVPDVAANASPRTGYRVVVDGQWAVIGGTSAVAPLYAGLTLLLCEAVGGPVGKRVDLLNTFVTNLGCFYDVTVGDNGAYRAGLGRDSVTGLGVLDGGKIRAVLTDDVPDPLPIGAGTPPTPTTVTFTGEQKTNLDRWAVSPHRWHNATIAARDYLTATGAADG